ncbi:Structural maintenance of chromosomes protein 5 [Oopsacas minuta]|uniref:Structural maintenance of chromosomes protein 5 n=1 Tax=Oopsacas minuta TaxID=111878 RepID=A0AAV7JSR2_9METZ|nr:Structural maintenance of chromosomes protein 5 [Oopsacas minuta]
MSAANLSEGIVKTEPDLSPVPSGGKDFATGAIVSIYLRNFVTYEEVKFYCKPGLNLILGPNGSGKSTIVCALCLGLGGSPKLLGRAKDVKEFVKRGCIEGEIELQLFRKRGRSLIIRRCINSTNSKSKWYIDGRPSKLETVTVEIQKMNIQLANLCQFLPQDKVVEFAKMDKYKLLRATEQAIGPADLDEMHEELINLRDKEKNTKKNLETMNDKCKQLTQLNQLVQGDVERYMERQKVIENVQELKQKKSLIEYRHARERWQNMNKNKKEAISILSQATKHLQPVESSITEVEKQIEKLRMESHQLSMKYRQGDKSLHQLIENIRQLVDELDGPRREFQEKQQQEQNRISKIESLQRDITKLQDELTNLPALVDIKPELNRLSKETKDIDYKIRNFQDRKDELNENKHHLIRQLDDIRREIHVLNDIRTQRLKMMAHSEPDTIASVEWLIKNKDRFKMQIFEPIITVVNATNVKYAKMLEACIKFKERYAFVAQNVEDAELFLEEQRVRKDLRIDCVRAPNKPLSSYQHPYPLEEIKKFRFETYISEIIDAPIPILAYMCENFNVHRIPIHKNKELAEHETKQIQAHLPNIRTFYTQEVRYVISGSRYDPDKRIIRTESIRNPYFLTKTGQVSGEAELQNKQEETLRKLSVLDTQLKSLDSHEQQLRVELEKLRRQKNSLTDVSSTRKKLDSNILIKNTKLDELSKTTFDVQAEERRCQEQIDAIQEKRIQISTKLSNMSRLQKDNIKEQLHFNLKKVQLGIKKSDRLRSIRKYKEEVEKAESKVAEFTEVEKELKNNANTLLGYVEELLGYKITEIPISMKQRLMTGTDEEDSLQKIQTQLHEYQAKLELCIATDPHTIRQYTDRNQEINGVRDAIERETKENDNTRGRIEQLKVRWLEPLKKLLEEVNNRFSYYFNQISCRGEVKLSIEDFSGEDEFDKYGVTINVKFRDEEELQQLTAFHQSGGERSVSTILYLMALQEHAQSPFRVVDEINQGMDSHYERCVFDFITNSASKQNTSQYFLLSPKLLPSLKFSPDMALHFICNGPGIGEISLH